MVCILRVFMGSRYLNNISVITLDQEVELIWVGANFAALDFVAHFMKERALVVGKNSLFNGIYSPWVNKHDLFS